MAVAVQRNVAVAEQHQHQQHQKHQHQQHQQHKHQHQHQQHQHQQHPEQKENVQATTDKNNKAKEQKRFLGRWYLGETLGKGGYSWVKKGKDRKNGRTVALKFMDRKKSSASGWNEKQIKQVKTEIECLRQIKHPHIMKLLAYNLNAKYPNKDDTTRDVILLVLEYMAGGELFDILYYTPALEEIIARTYFRQLIEGVEACHNSCIIHRDIKPQNLLLDAKFKLKITDFGLAKLIESDSDAVMQTYHVGTRGYQAPEVLARKAYTGACDIFSCGVVLFILLSGYPPFEHAKETDRWYGYISNGEYRKFWKAHRGCGIKPQAIDLITRMLTYDPEKRITIGRIKKHPWYNGDILQQKDLIQLLKLRHAQMEKKRAQDPVKQSILNDSVKRNVPITLGGATVSPNIKAPPLPDEEAVGLTDAFTTLPGYAVLAFMETLVQEKMGGQCTVDINGFQMEIQVAAQSVDVDQFRNEFVHFCVNIYDYPEYHCNLVKFKRLTGSVNFWKTTLQLFTKQASEVLTGLPNTPDLTEQELDFVTKYFPQGKGKKKRNRNRQNDNNNGQTQQIDSNNNNDVNDQNDVANNNNNNNNIPISV